MNRSILFKQQPGNPRPNPRQYEKEVIDGLCAKSNFLFQRKWRWRVLCAKAKATPEQMSKTLDILVDQKIQAIKEYNETLKQSVDSSGRNNNGELPSGESDNNVSTTDNGSEVRPSEANDESVTAGGN